MRCLSHKADGLTTKPHWPGLSLFLTFIGVMMYARYNIIRLVAVPFIAFLLHARHWAQHFTHSISLNPHSSLTLNMSCCPGSLLPLSQVTKDLVDEHKFVLQSWRPKVWNESHWAKIFIDKWHVPNNSFIIVVYQV